LEELHRFSDAVSNDQDSDFIAFATYYKIEIKLAEWAIHLFYVPGTQNMKNYFAIFSIFEEF